MIDSQSIIRFKRNPLLNNNLFKYHVTLLLLCEFTCLKMHLTETMPTYPKYYDRIQILMV
jgi:hypothetical protein